jgi:hypothetical protein
MIWSQKQRMLFLKSSNLAKWSPAMRYIAMHHAGCPTDRMLKRCSVKHKGNTNQHFARAMELAEAQAIETVPPPRDYHSWADAARRDLDKRRDFARQIVAEAVTRMPNRFATTPEGEPVERVEAIERMLTAAVQHVTAGDSIELTPIKPLSLDECDTGQLYRVIESLKAWLGREFLKAGLCPESFEPPASAKRRAAS